MASFEEMRSTGVLWALNRVLFHPRGYALGFTYPDSVTKEEIMRHDVEPTGWTLYGDGTEVWAYADEEDIEFEAFAKLLLRQRMAEGEVHASDGGV